MEESNIFTTSWDFSFDGASGLEYPERDDLFVMTEPPYTEGAPEGETRGRLLRVFHRADGAPVPPDPDTSA
jgi:hypothetical protein